MRTLKTIADLPRDTDPSQLRRLGQIGVSLSGKYLAVVSTLRGRDRLLHTATTVGWVDLPDEFQGDYEVLSVTSDRVSVRGVYNSPNHPLTPCVFVFSADGEVVSWYEDPVSAPVNTDQTRQVYEFTFNGEDMPVYQMAGQMWMFGDRGIIPGHVSYASLSPDNSSVLLVIVPHQADQPSQVGFPLRQIVVVRPGAPGRDNPFRLLGCTVNQLVLARFNQFRIQWRHDRPTVRLIEHYIDDSGDRQSRELFLSEDTVCILDGSDQEWTDAVFHNGSIYYIRQDDSISILVRSGQTDELLDAGDDIWNLRLGDGHQLTYNRIDGNSLQSVRQQI